MGRTGYNHPSLVFLDLDQAFLGARLEEYSQGLEPRVLNIHWGLCGLDELGWTIRQDMRLVENRWRDREGPGRQLRQCNENRFKKGRP